MRVNLLADVWWRIKESKGYAWFPKENESEIWRMKLYNGDKDRFID